MSDGHALKLGLEPGEYRCTWTLEDDGGDGAIEISGDLELREDDAPRGYMYGDRLPVEWVGGQRHLGAGFPQHRHYVRVVGQLVNGQAVHLVDCDMHIWMPERAILHPRAVLVGNHIPASGEPRFQSIKVQVTGLDVVAGIGPMSRR